MRVNIPRSWQSLPQAQRKKIEEYLREVVVKEIEKDTRIMLDIYIKMVCVVLHDAFGFGEKRLNMFLGNHRRLFATQRRMVKNNTQLKYLDKRMSEIFRKGGFPQSFFDNMLGEVETPIKKEDT